jgi:hypothetical protein
LDIIVGWGVYGFDVTVGIGALIGGIVWIVVGIAVWGGGLVTLVIMGGVGDGIVGSEKVGNHTPYWKIS